MFLVKNDAQYQVQSPNKSGLKICFLNVHKETYIYITQIPGSPQFHITHIASDHNIKADCKCFVKCPKISPILCLVIFGKPAFK